MSLLSLVNYKSFFSGLVLLALLILGFLSPALVHAEGITDDPVDVETCGDFNDLTGPCAKPPTLKLVEIWVIKGVYIVWALGGIIFLVGLVSIGFRWMTGGGDQQKLEELKKQATYWAISIPVFFGGVPAISFILRVFPINQEALCLQQLNLPAFQIIFPNACRVQSSIPGVEPGDLDPDTGCPTWCFTPQRPNADYSCFGTDGLSYSCCNPGYHYSSTGGTGGTGGCVQD